MRIDLTAEQKEALDYVALKDDWTKEPTDREELERRVCHKMHDGTSFPQAVIRVLDEAERPADPPVIDPAKEALKAQIVAQQAAREEAFLKILEGSKRGLLNENLKNRLGVALAKRPAGADKRPD